MDANRDTTQKITGLPAKMQMNEQEYAQYCYDRANERMQSDPTAENIAAFEAANKKLWETLDNYRIAKRLLLERASNLVQAFFGEKTAEESQKLHRL